jgi:tetratricopeptide (TPR) repeat protein
LLEEGDSIRDYTLRRFLGKGSYGEVWLAERVIELANESIPFALKILTPQSGEAKGLTAVNTEIKTWLKAGNHLNIVPVYDGFVQGRFLIIISEYVEDGSLRDWLIKNGNRAPSIEKAVEMMRGILRGLDHLHTKRIIHRDLKPENILLKDEVPKITDFGVSRVVETFSENRTARYTKGAGAPMYMPPEAFSDCNPTPQLDTWSAGILFYEMLTGACPFNADTLPGLLGEITNKEPAPLPAPLKELQEFVTTSLTKEVDRRFQTAGQMAEALEHAWAQMESQRNWQHGTVSNQAAVIDQMLDREVHMHPDNTNKDNNQALPPGQDHSPTTKSNKLPGTKSHWLKVAVILLIAAIGAGVWFGAKYLFRATVENSAVLMTQAKDCLDAKNFDCAIDGYTKLIALQPQSGEAYYGRGRAYNKKGDFARGIIDFNKAIELQPAYAEAYTYRGAANAVLGKFDEAINDLTKAIQLNPQIYDAYYNRGLAHRNSGNRDQAIKDFETAIALDPKEPKGFFERGFTYNGQGNRDEAIRDFNKAIDLNSQSSDAHRERGMAYLFEGNIDQAIKDLDKALELNRKDPLTWYHRALAYGNRGNHDQAKRDFTQAIELDPGLAEAYVYRGSSFCNKGDYEQGFRDFNKAIELNPRLPEAFYYRGFAYGNRGNHLQAKDDFTRAIELRPTYAEAYYMRAQAYQRLGQRANAMLDEKKYRGLAVVRPKNWDGQ